MNSILVDVLTGAATVVSLMVLIHCWWGPTRIWICRLLTAALVMEGATMVLGWQHPTMPMMRV